jgi:hypothetical protein
MNLFDRTTLRWALEVLGLAALILACFFHSWALDGMGVGLLLISAFLDPPAGLFAVLLSAGQPPLTGPYTILPDFQRGGQYEFRFDDPLGIPGLDYNRCAYAVTPCGRPTSVRAWGDLH